MPARSAEIFFLYPGAPARVVAFCDRVAITHPQGVRDFQLLQIKKPLGVFVKDLFFDLRPITPRGCGYAADFPETRNPSAEYPKQRENAPRRRNRSYAPAAIRPARC